MEPEEPAALTPTDPPQPAPAGWCARGASLAEGLRLFLVEHAERATRSRRELEERLTACSETHARRVRHAEAELLRRTQKAEAQLAEAIERIDAELEGELERARREWAVRMEEFRERCERRTERNERKRREAVWLAETVLESGRPKPRQAHEALCKRLDEGLRASDEWLEFTCSQWPAACPSVPREAPQEAPGEASDREEDFEALVGAMERAARGLDRRLLLRFFRAGAHLVLIPCAGVGAGVGLAAWQGWGDWRGPVLAGAGGVAVAAGLLLPLRVRARGVFRSGLAGLGEMHGRLRGMASAVRSRSERERDEALSRLVEACRAEVERAETEARDARELLESEQEAERRELEGRRSREVASIEGKAARARETARERAAAYTERARATHDAEVESAQRERREAEALAREHADRAMERLRAEWRERVDRDSAMLGALVREAERASPGWSERVDGSWRVPADLRVGALLGHVRMELADLIGKVPGEVAPAPGPPEWLTLPVVLDTRAESSLLVEADAASRDAGLALLQAALLRLLAAIPAGRAKLTIVDPVGRGRSFAGLMRLTDHDESLVGSRIWTESRHIERRLADLTEHIENVIQKYLRNEYETIDEYNREAGEIAEPYRYLVVADYPANFSDDAAARLASIVDAGPRCGVFVVMLTDPEAPSPFDLSRLRERAVVVRGRGGELRLARPDLSDAPFEAEAPPPEDVTAALLDRVGAESLSAGRVEVRYGVVAPAEGERWSRSASEELRIPIGRAGATRAQELRLGRGTSQHALIAGKTGSGKSTLLHVLTTAAMLWHDPSEVEFYLVDFKKGVEFKPYASGLLPHIRAVAIESDREFGLSVLARLDEELRRRGDLFRERGVQSLAQFRDRYPDEPMPRSVLIIDEFQEFFTEDDGIAQDAALLLDRLVRQGRAFGVHVLLASQTLSGAYTLSRSTMGQMAVRIAMKCSETDSYLILSEDNGAARLLSRPGEAIYNDANGLVEGNSPFQVAWLSDEQRREVLNEIAGLASERGVAFAEPVFFEGNAPAELGRNRALRRALEGAERPLAPVAWLGDPVSIKSPTGATMRRRGGANLLIVGQRAETAGAMLAASAVSLAAQHDASGARGARFVLIDGTPEDDPLAGRLAEALGALPQGVRCVGWREAPEAVAEAHAEMTARDGQNRTDGPAVYVLVHGLHWLRSLRRRDDDFSFSLSAEAEGPTPDQQLKQVLLDGPRLGVFVLAWCDTAASLTRALDRASIGEFGNRVLMQMSANDSSMLIESTSAARLGLHRAIFFDEERGAEEKFRPYALPTPGEISALFGHSPKPAGG